MNLIAGLAHRLSELSNRVLIVPALISLVILNPLLRPLKLAYALESVRALAAYPEELVDVAALGHIDQK